ncbi:hypothetical protein CEXT_808191 [Caerostris extrusa]|uniref:Uncharacterized protein n=1 Tax=Caerostris extrusa TaxID=172846 RepID=A0AAV4S7J6_CAEEX|nr:hypothetical protein CEXT_808191 [Caerostris extrusa]
MSSSSSNAISSLLKWRFKAAHRIDLSLMSLSGEDDVVQKSLKRGFFFIIVIHFTVITPVFRNSSVSREDLKESWKNGKNENFKSAEVWVKILTVLFRDSICDVELKTSGSTLDKGEDDVVQKSLKRGFFFIIVIHFTVTTPAFCNSSVSRKDLKESWKNGKNERFGCFSSLCTRYGTENIYEYAVDVDDKFVGRNAIGLS